jgi:hypothetical protein
MYVFGIGILDTTYFCIMKNNGTDLTKKKTKPIILNKRMKKQLKW